MNIERPGSPSATIVAPASKRRSTSIETRRSRLASERPPKKGVASKNAFRSGELTAIGPIYSRSRQRQVRKPSFAAARLPVSSRDRQKRGGHACVTRQFWVPRWSQPQRFSRCRRKPVSVISSPPKRSASGRRPRATPGFRSAAPRGRRIISITAPGMPGSRPRFIAAAPTGRIIDTAAYRAVPRTYLCSE